MPPQSASARPVPRQREHSRMVMYDPSDFGPIGSSQPVPLHRLHGGFGSPWSIHSISSGDNSVLLCVVIAFSILVGNPKLSPNRLGFFFACSIGGVPAAQRIEGPRAPSIPSPCGRSRIARRARPGLHSVLGVEPVRRLAELNSESLVELDCDTNCQFSFVVLAHRF